MILSKTPHKLGCTYKIAESKTKKELSREDFILFVNDIVSGSIKNGIDVTCLEIANPGLFNYDFTSVEEGDSDSEALDELSRKLRQNSHRLFIFLSQYYFLGSQIAEVVDQTHEVILNLSCFMEIIGQTEPSIIIRVGSAYGNRKETLSRFVRETLKINKGARKMLVVTNDEKPSLFSVTDLLSGIFYEANIPICFRSLPHTFNSGGLTFREALFLSCSTWDSSLKPIYIHSESSIIDENGASKSPTPNERLSHRIPIFGLDVDVILDSPNSLKTCIDYMAKSRTLKPMVINKSSK
jgi:UV DNA damage endonuclease